MQEIESQVPDGMQKARPLGFEIGELNWQFVMKIVKEQLMRNLGGELYYEPRCHLEAQHIPLDACNLDRGRPDPHRVHLQLHHDTRYAMRSPQC